MTFLATVLYVYPPESLAMMFNPVRVACTMLEQNARTSGVLAFWLRAVGETWAAASMSRLGT